MACSPCLAMLHRVVLHALPVSLAATPNFTAPALLAATDNLSSDGAANVIAAVSPPPSPSADLMVTVLGPPVSCNPPRSKLSPNRIFENFPAAHSPMHAAVALQPRLPGAADQERLNQPLRQIFQSWYPLPLRSGPRPLVKL